MTPVGTIIRALAPFTLIFLCSSVSSVVNAFTHEFL
jgi:hypothetical protein